MTQRTRVATKKKKASLFNTCPDCPAANVEPYERRSLEDDLTEQEIQEWEYYKYKEIFEKLMKFLAIHHPEVLLEIFGDFQ